MPEILGVLASSPLLVAVHRQHLERLIAELSAGDPLDLEQRYVSLFDTGRATCLWLFEHVHGESRDRGQAMVDLKGIYERAGFHLAANELPDYLPAVLEYLSYRDLAESVGVSKSSAQSAVAWLIRRKLISSTKASVTATPSYAVHTPWQADYRRRASHVAV